MSVLRCVLLCSITMALSPLRAHAGPPAVSPKVEAQADEYVTKGIAAQEAGDYDKAIGLYWKAHELVKRPVLLFNLAQAHRLAGRIDEALALYKRYLDEDPEGAQANLAREFIAELKPRKPETPPPPTKPSNPVPAPSTVVASADPVPRPVEARVAAESPGRNLRVVGLVAGAAGLVSIGVAIKYGLRAESISDKFSQPGAPYTRAEDDEGRSANTTAIAGWVSGGLLIGLGSTLYWLGYRQGKQPEALTLAPVISDRLTGLVVSGQLP